MPPLRKKNVIRELNKLECLLKSVMAAIIFQGIGANGNSISDELNEGAGLSCALNDINAPTSLSDGCHAFIS